MKFIEIINDNPWILKLFYSLVAVLIGLLIYAFITKVFINKIEIKLSSKKYKTYVKLIKSINKYIIILIVVAAILKINGVNVSTMVTGVGIIGIIIGFAIQDALKDIIKGFDIISDSYFNVGDIISFEKYTGKVLSIGIKTTKIEDIYTMNIVSISNRNIEKVEVISHLTCIEVPLPYELKLKNAEAVINYIVDNISKLKNVEKAEYIGVNELADSSIKCLIKIFSLPSVKLQVRRDALSCVLNCLEEKNIQVPYNQLDIHNK